MGVLSKILTGVATDNADDVARKVASKVDDVVLDSLNPTGKIFTKYNPQARATAKLGNGITTLDRTMGRRADDLVDIFRGVPKGIQSSIVPGDYVTTNKMLAQDYAGSGDVLSMKARLGDILDSISEPLGEEYIYRPSVVNRKF